MVDKMYDERYYLNDKSFIKEFEYNSYIRSLNVEIQNNKFKKTIKKYDELINKLAYLLKKLGYDSSLDTSLILSFIINNGLLSYDKVLKNSSTSDELIDKLGISIIRGYGVCRNYSSIHKDIFRINSMFDKYFYCYEGIGSGIGKQANHVINLIKYNDNYYGFDMYNGNRLYRFINEFEVREISLNTNYKLRYKPYYEIVSGESNIDDINRYLDTFRICSKNKYIDPYEYDQLKFKINNRIKGDSLACFEFYEKNKKLIKSIYDDMNNGFNKINN